MKLYYRFTRRRLALMFASSFVVVTLFAFYGVALTWQSFLVVSLLLSLAYRLATLLIGYDWIDGGQG